MRYTLSAISILPVLAQAGAIPWNDPGEVSREYSPAIHEARGIVPEYRAAQTSLLTRFQHPGTDLEFMAASGLDLSATARFGTVQIPVLVRWKLLEIGLDAPIHAWRKGDDGKSNTGIGDVWLHAGWFAGDSALSTEVTGLIKTPTGLENPETGAVLGSGTWDGGIQGLVSGSFREFRLGLGATAILSGEQTIDVQDGKTLRKRVYDAGDFLSLQGLVRYRANPWLEVGADANLTHQTRGLVSYDSVARPLAPISMLAIEPNVTIRRAELLWSLGASLPVASSLDLSWTPSISTSLHYQFNIGKSGNSKVTIPPPIPAASVIPAQILEATKPKEAKPTPVIETPKPVVPTVPVPVIETPKPVVPAIPVPVIEAPKPVTPTVPTPIIETSKPVTPTVPTPVIETPKPVAPTVPTPVIETPKPVAPTVPTPIVEAPKPVVPASTVPDVTEDLSKLPMPVMPSEKELPIAP